MNHFDFTSVHYFGIKIGKSRIAGRFFAVAQVFRRVGVAGLSLLQFGKRHLLYVGQDSGSPRVCVGFVWLTPQHA